MTTIARVETTELTTAVGRGLESGKPEDLLLPRIILMQAQSKFVVDEGKKPGTFVNSITKEEYPTLEFVPIIMTKYWDVLKPDGTKMVFDYRVTSEADQRLTDKRFFNDGEDKANVNTVMAFISLVNDTPAIVTFTKTNYKTGKKLYTMARVAKGDLFSNSYKLISKKETRNDNTYFVSDVEPLGHVSDEVLKVAEGYYETFKERIKEINTVEGKEEVPF